MRIEAEVKSLYIGDQAGLEKTPHTRIEVNLEGIVGDKHSGFERKADSRANQYPRGELIRNERQWSAVSPEELQAIADSMGVPSIDAGWVGANLSLAGIPNLTELPKGSKLVFPQNAVLLVEDENLPCVQPGEVIASKYPELGLKPSIFPKAAMGKRGLVGVVEREGIITLEDVITVEVYEPKAYSLPPNLQSS